MTTTMNTTTTMKNRNRGSLINMRNKEIFDWDQLSLLLDDNCEGWNDSSKGSNMKQVESVVVGYLNRFLVYCHGTSKSCYLYKSPKTTGLDTDTGVKIVALDEAKMTQKMINKAVWIRTTTITTVPSLPSEMTTTSLPSETTTTSLPSEMTTSRNENGTERKRKRTHTSSPSLPTLPTTTTTFKKPEHSRCVRKNIFCLWQYSILRAEVQGLVFDPYPLNHVLSTSTSDLLNYYHGMPWTKEECLQAYLSPEGSYGMNLVISHLRGILCNGDEKMWKYVEQWWASIKRRPEKKLQTFLVFTGAQGSGKSGFLQGLMAMFTPYTEFYSSVNQLLQRFNDGIQYTLLVLVDELAKTRLTQNQMAQLNSLVTDGTARTERKFQDAVTDRVFTNYMFCTNDPEIGGLMRGQSNKARRVVVIPSSLQLVHAEPSKTAEYFENLYRSMRGANNYATLKAFSHFLDITYSDSDLDSFGLGANYPISEQWLIARQSCMDENSVLSWWYHALRRGYHIPLYSSSDAHTSRSIFENPSGRVDQSVLNTMGNMSPRSSTRVIFAWFEEVGEEDIHKVYSAFCSQNRLIPVVDRMFVQMTKDLLGDGDGDGNEKKMGIRTKNEKGKFLTHRIRSGNSRVCKRYIQIPSLDYCREVFQRNTHIQLGLIDNNQPYSNPNTCSSSSSCCNTQSSISITTSSFNAAPPPPSSFLTEDESYPNSTYYNESRQQQEHLYMLSSSSSMTHNQHHMNLAPLIQEHENENHENGVQNAFRLDPLVYEQQQYDGNHITNMDKGTTTTTTDKGEVISEKLHSGKGSPCEDWYPHEGLPSPSLLPSSLWYGESPSPHSLLSSTDKGYTTPRQSTLNAMLAHISSPTSRYRHEDVNPKDGTQSPSLSSSSRRRHTQGSSQAITVVMKKPRTNTKTQKHTGNLTPIDISSYFVKRNKGDHHGDGQCEYHSVPSSPYHYSGRDILQNLNLVSQKLLSSSSSSHTTNMSCTHTSQPFYPSSIPTLTSLSSLHSGSYSVPLSPRDCDLNKMGLLPPLI
jgi:Family of unknown function (DUF5906)